MSPRWASRASAGVRSLVAGTLPTIARKKPLVMLQAYIDESNSEIGDRRFLLAGYLHTAPAWEEFSDYWDQQCKASPRIDYLHMVDAQSLRGQFRGWRPEDRDRKVLALARVIRYFQPHSMCCSVSRKGYLELVAPHAPYHFKNPYFACFYGITLGLAHLHADSNLTSPMDLIFDQNSASQDVLMCYDFVRAEQIPEVAASMRSTPLFRDDIDVLPLQAADMLVWHLRREAEGTADAHHLETLRVMSEGSIRASWNISRAELESMAKNFARLDTKGLQTKGQWRTTSRWIRGMQEAGHDVLMDVERPRGFIARAYAILSRLFRTR
jgi:hypothetical protein